MFSFVFAAAVLKVVCFFVRLCYLYCYLVILRSSELISVSDILACYSSELFSVFLVLSLFSSVIVLHTLFFFEELAFRKNYRISHSPLHPPPPPHLVDI